MQLKQYFTDGLVQIAIVLSLLRIDLNSYLNTSYVNYPEVQELILGQTAVYTQTNFHRSSFENHYSGYDHLKTLENEASILQDLRSLSRFASHQVARQQGITTFLVGISNGGGHLLTNSQETQSANVENNDSASATTEQSSENAQEEDNAVSQENEEVVLVQVNAENPLAVDPSFEDLDLIDVLWRQDIDLGVGKEMFDVNLRRELEREREIELQKERQKQKDRELLQAKLEEQRRRREQQWMAENFMRDGETGEWVPLNGRRTSQPMSSPSMVPPNMSPQVSNVPPPNVTNIQQNNPHSMNQTNQFQNYQSYETGMPVMSNPMQPHLNVLENDYHIPTSNQSYQHQLASPSHQPSPSHITSPLHHMSPDQNHLQNYSYNQTQQQSPGSYHPQENMTQAQYPQAANRGYGTNNSLEETWMDLVNILELPSNDSNTGMVNNLSTSVGMMPPQNHSNALIQNVTMPTPINNTVNTNTFEPQTRNNFTSAPPSEGCSSPLEWDPANMLFNNNSAGAEQNSNLTTQVDDILSNIIDEGLDDLNITEMAIEEGLGSMQMLDDASSESGISMGSSGGSPSQDQFSEGAMSPYDGMEGGARGGGDFGDGTPDFGKRPRKFSFNGGFNYNENGGESAQSNYSSSSNDTDYHYRPSSANHIRHNHSYPLQPGQEPREYKKYTISDKPKQKGPHCRDKKRLEDLKVPLTMDEIVDSPVEEFNEMLTRHKLSESQLQLIRDIRRRGKNKVAAQNCRKRKMDVIVTLEDEMTQLKESRERLMAERQMIDKQTRDMKDKYSALYREIFLSLRDEHGRPYDPALFSLQQSSDGNVFLVPKNVTSEEQMEMNKKIKEERDKDSH